MVAIAQHHRDNGPTVDRIRGSLQMMCRAMNGGWSAMGAALGMTVSSLENRVYGRKGQDITVATAMRMQQASDTCYFAEAVAAASGGVFVALPPFGEAGNIDIQQKYVELIEQVGALAREYREATADDEVCTAERRRLERLGHRICQLVTQINQMTFRIYCKQD